MVKEILRFEHRTLFFPRIVSGKVDKSCKYFDKECFQYRARSSFSRIPTSGAMPLLNEFLLYLHYLSTGQNRDEKTTGQNRNGV